MATAIDVLVDALSRIEGGVHGVVDGLSAAQANARPAPGANPISWLVWHITRGQDAQVAEVAGFDEAWTSLGWADKFGYDLPLDANGYGFTADQVDQVTVTDPALLTAYYDAVNARTLNYLNGLAEADLDRIVDRSWDPPVTLGVRLFSILDDDIQHLGQARYVRGLIERAATA